MASGFSISFKLLACFARSRVKGIQAILIALDYPWPMCYAILESVSVGQFLFPAARSGSASAASTLKGHVSTFLFCFRDHSPLILSSRP